MTDFAVTTNFSAATTAVASEVNQNFEDVEDVFNGDANSYTAQTPALTPIGAVVGWLKTFTLVDSGTADTNTLNALEDSGATFVSTGVVKGMIVVNTTDSPDSYAMADVITETKVTLLGDINGGSSVTDIFPDGADAYSIYSTPELPDGWVECNGQALSGAFADADSPFNGDTLPDLNSGTQRFLRGSISSGTTGGADTVAHTHPIANVQASGGNQAATDNEHTPANTGATSDDENMPAFYEVTFIMRIK